jgi:type IV pilus assembly protein PilB
LHYHYRVRFGSTASCAKSRNRRWRKVLSARIKVISRLDISEKRVPQDGRMKLKFGNKAIDFRVSTLPTLFGEKIVIRILDPSSAKVGIEALGYEKIEKDRLMKAIQRPYGMVLVTGPTGSGKTVSLYTCLNILNQPGVNIATVEDPAEINLPGVNQVNVNDRAGLTFAVALKSFLRQDPDIIMVGEIRDLETAEWPSGRADRSPGDLDAAHATRRRPDAPVEHGRDGLQHRRERAAVTAQRLAQLCELQGARPTILARQCSRPASSRKIWTTAGSRSGPSAVQCNNGYKGRVGIYRVMPITEEIRRSSSTRAARWTSSRPEGRRS